MQSFVPATDEVGRLQRCDDPDCQLFQDVAEHGHYGGRTEPSPTRQGIYAATPDGQFLGSLNTHNTDKVLEMMKTALKKWKDLSREERLRSSTPEQKTGQIHRAKNKYPENGLVLRQFVRDLPREENRRSSRRDDWNRDFVWFRSGEARQFLPEQPEPGATRELPRPLTMRLARFHLVDFVLGQSPGYPAEAVENAVIRSRVTGVDGSEVSLRLKGNVRVKHTGTWSVCGFDGEPSEQSRGFDGNLLGRAVFDRAENRFTEFELVAAGTRWGGTKYNDRCKDLMKNPIGFVFLLNDNRKNSVPPARIWNSGYW